MPRTTRLARLFFPPRCRTSRLTCESLEQRLLPAAGLPTVLPAPSAWTPAAVFQQAVGRFSASATALRPAREVGVDFTGDGIADRAALVECPAGGVDQLFLYRGTPAGRFELQERLSLDAVANSILADDLNGDGAIDLFIHDADGDHATLLLNRGDDLFDVYHRNANESALATGDLTGHQRDDLVYTSAQGDELWMQSADGQRQLLLAGHSDLLSPRTLALADLTRDGHADLIVGAGGGRLLILPGRGDGSFAPELNGGLGLPAGRLPVQVSVARLADIDERDPITVNSFDPYPDLVITDQASDAVQLYYGGRDGMRYGGAIRTGTAPSATAVSDVNGDGLSDLVVTCSGSNEVWLIPGRAGGGFDEMAARVLSTGPHPHVSYLGDFDGDHEADLVTLNGYADTLTYYPHVAIASAAVTLHTSGAAPVAGLVQDVNQDGLSDLFVGTADGRLDLYSGTASGLQWTQTLLRTGGSLSALAATISEPGRVYALTTSSGEAAVVMVTTGETAATPATPSAPPDDSGASASSPVVVSITVLFPTLVSLLPLSAGTSDVVPLLLPGPHEEAGADSAGRRGPAPAAVEGVVEGGHPAPLRDGDGPPADAELSPVQRFILGVDEAAAPVLGLEGTAARPAAPALPAGPRLPMVPAPTEAPLPPTEDGPPHNAVLSMTADEAPPDETPLPLSVVLACRDDPILLTLLVLSAGRLRCELDRHLRRRVPHGSSNRRRAGEVATAE